LHSGTILVLDEPFLVGFDPEGIAEGRTALRMLFLVFPLLPRNVKLPSTVIFEVQRAIGFQLWNRDRAISPFLLNFHSLLNFDSLVCHATCSPQPNTQGRSDFENSGKVVTKQSQALEGTRMRLEMNSLRKTGSATGNRTRV
jgi:hypothetical protein